VLNNCWRVVFIRYSGDIILWDNDGELLFSQFEEERTRCQKDDLRNYSLHLWDICFLYHRLGHGQIRKVHSSLWLWVFLLNNGGYNRGQVCAVVNSIKSAKHEEEQYQNNYFVSESDADSRIEGCSGLSCIPWNKRYLGKCT